MPLFLKGQTPWNKGTKGIMKSWLKGKHIQTNTGKTHFKKGMTPWNKGKKCPNLNQWKGKTRSKEDREKISVTLKSKMKSGEIPLPKRAFKKGHKTWSKGIHLDYMQKEKHPMWKGGITSLNQRIRHCDKYNSWRNMVFERDLYTCQLCSMKGVFIEAHHKKKFSLIMEENKIKTYEQAITCTELWNISNGLTLCTLCHKKIGKGV